MSRHLPPFALAVLFLTYACSSPPRTVPAPDVAPAQTPPPGAVQQAANPTVAWKVEKAVNDGTVPDAKQVQAFGSERLTQMSNAVRDSRGKGKFLGVSAGVGNAIIKAGQYLGGGGAIFLGLQSANASDATAAQSKGRNAAYAAAVGALVTALEQAFNLDHAKQVKKACNTVVAKKDSIESVVSQWNLQAQDPAFRKTFLTTQAIPLSLRIATLHEACINPAD